MFPRAVDPLAAMIVCVTLSNLLFLISNIFVKGACSCIAMLHRRPFTYVGNRVSAQSGVDMEQKLSHLALHS